jgi:hypothetical protein
MAGDREDDAVDDSGGGQRMATHGRERERGEQPHRGDDDERARVPQHMREIELRRGCHRATHHGRHRAGLAGGEKFHEPAHTVGVECAGRYGRAQVVFRELH